MALTTYTSFDEVRAVLGVSNDELDDVTLALPVYEDMLRMEIDGVDTGIHDKFIEIVDVVSPTSSEQRFLRYFRLFCTFATAKSLASALPMFGPKSIGDGKASMSRFSDSPYKNTLAKIDAEFGRMTTLLANAYASLAQTSTTAYSRPWLSTTGSAIDPVTGA